MRNKIEWRSCPDWPDYEVSENGDIKRVVKGKNGFIGNRKPYLASNGRMMIVMRSGEYKKACHIHRLVLKAFVGPPPSENHECAHNDGDCLNNHISNLRWATRSENELDKVLHGTSNRGERFGRARLKNIQAAEIKILLSKGSKQTDISKSYGIPLGTIKSLAQGRSWFWMSLDDAKRLVAEAGIGINPEKIEGKS